VEEEEDTDLDTEANVVTSNVVRVFLVRFDGERVSNGVVDSVVASERERRER